MWCVLPTECPVWEVTQNAHGINGVEYEEAGDEASCKQACVNNPACVGFDLVRTDTPNGCWLHFSTTDFTPPVEQNGIDLYVLSARCPGRFTLGRIYSSSLKSSNHCCINTLHYLSISASSTAAPGETFK